MTIAILKDQGEVTIPDDIREQLGMRTGDMFDVSILHGNIVLVPQEPAFPIKSEPRSKGIDIRHFIGSGKGLFATPAEVDAFIAAERDSWD